MYIEREGEVRPVLEVCPGDPVRFKVDDETYVELKDAVILLGEGVPFQGLEMGND